MTLVQYDHLIYNLCWKFTIIYLLFIFSSFDLFYFMGFAWIYVYVSRACLVPKEVRQRCWIPWNWSHRQLWVAMWVLNGSSAKATNTLNHRATSPADYLLSLVCVWHICMCRGVFACLRGIGSLVTFHLIFLESLTRPGAHHFLTRLDAQQVLPTKDRVTSLLGKVYPDAQRIVSLGGWMAQQVKALMAQAWWTKLEPQQPH